MKKSIAVVTATLAATSVPAIAQLVAGWDSWDTAAAPTVTRLAPDVSASAVTTLDPGDMNQAWRVNDGRGGSSDGDWGTAVSTPPATDVAGDGLFNTCLELGNATTGGTITVTITNNGTSELALGSFHFDAYAFRPKAARTYELSVVEGGGITPGVIYTSGAQEITHVGGAWDNMAHDDIDHDLTGLADNVLAPGESVDFLLVVSGGAGDASGGHDLWIDNLAVFTAPVELPPITDFKITKDETDVTLTFNSPVIVNVYRSSDLETWDFLADEVISPYFDEVDEAPTFFYRLEPTSVPVPEN